MPHKWVIAGTREEYKHWLRSRPEALHGEYAYVADVVMLKGYSKPTGIFIGTWYDRPDIDNILNQLLIASEGVRSEGLMKALAIREEVKNRERLVRDITNTAGIIAQTLPKEFIVKVNGGA